MTSSSLVRLHLVRHGQTRQNLDMRFPGVDARLTDEGRAQAKRIGRELVRRELLVETILVSPTARTFETMENARALLPNRPRIIVIAGLAEKNPGGAEGRPIPGNFADVDSLTVRMRGESFPRFIERVENAFRGLFEDIRNGKIPGNDIVLFGHSLVNRIGLGVAQGIGGARGLEGPSQINGGIKTIELRRN